MRVLATWVEPLIVAHVNHRLRGADSDADEQFCRELAHQFGSPFRNITIDVRSAADAAHGNLENAARQIRYDFLSQVARECDAVWIATGHTADDQAETILHRLLRGAGIQGLRGIAARREASPGVELIRPLLHATRADVVAYLNSLNQPWREDASNRDCVYTRNRIRHELMPILRAPTIPQDPRNFLRAARGAGRLARIHEEQEAAALQLLQRAELPSAGGLRIFRVDELRPMPRHRVRGMFRMLWQREGWPASDMTFEHWKRLVAVALGEETASDLPGGIVARCKGDVVQVGT